MSLMPDPMTLHYDVLEKILNYLNVQDLLEASIVCKNWYDTIGTSDTFRKKVCIVIHRWNRSRNVNLITESTRDYQKFWIADQEIGFEILFLGTKNWKKVVINLAFPWLSYFNRYMEYFKPTVRELKLLNCIIVTDNCDDKTALVLPYLEDLFLSDVSVLVLNSFMATHEKLKTLHLQNIRHHKETSTEGPAIRSFLKLNKSLKELVMHADVTNSVFDEDIAHSFNFELKSLTLCLDEEKASTNGQLYIIKFIQSQGIFLESLNLVFNQRNIRQNHQMFWGRQHNRLSEVVVWKDFAIIAQAWNYMTSLKRLAFRFTKNSKDNEDVEAEQNMVMLPNYNIQEIAIHSAGCRMIPWRLLKFVLQASPNVEKLYIFYLTKDVLQFIALKMLKVQTVNCELMEYGTRVFIEELKTLQGVSNKTMVVTGREETTAEEQQERNNWENDEVVAGGIPIANIFHDDDSESDFDDSDHFYRSDDEDDDNDDNDNAHVDDYLAAIDVFRIGQWEP